MKVCVVGRGKVGRTLARELRQAELACTLVSGRNPTPREPYDVYLLAVPDHAIHDTAASLAARVNGREVALHCAGARDESELLPLAARGLSVGMFHPLISFAGATPSLSLRHSTFTFSGDARAEKVARKLARKLGARCVALPAAGPAYHAAAALVANGTVALAQQGSRILRSLGFTQREAERALAGLLASVAHNVAARGLPAALTGPVVRGDVATVARHLAALEQLERRLAHSYRTTLPAIIEAARDAGLSPTLARKLRALAQTTEKTRTR